MMTLRKEMPLLFVGVVMLVVLTFTSCGRSNVNTVRNGILEINKTTTIGKALEKNPLIGNGKWDQYETKNGAEIVAYRKKLDYAGINEIVKAYIRNNAGNASNLFPDGLGESMLLQVAFTQLWAKGESDYFKLADSNGLPVSDKQLINNAFSFTTKMTNRLSSSNYEPPDYDDGRPRFTEGSASVFFTIDASNKKSFSFTITETVIKFSIPALEIENYTLTMYDDSTDILANIYNGNWM